MAETMLAAVRAAVAVERDDLFSATLLDSVLLCRYLGDSAESAGRCFTDAWGAVRPVLLGRSSTATDLEDVSGLSREAT